MDRFEAVITIILGLSVSIVGSWIYKTDKKFIKLLIALCIFSVLIILIILPDNKQTGLEDKEITNIKAALNNKGYLLYTEGKFKEAITYYERAIDEDPEYKLARNNKVDALRKLTSTREQ
jgi:tetratricopeptide (TPR) repeat protein